MGIKTWVASLARIMFGGPRANLPVGRVKCALSIGSVAFKILCSKLVVRGFHCVIKIGQGLSEKSKTKRSRLLEADWSEA